MTRRDYLWGAFKYRALPVVMWCSVAQLFYTIWWAICNNPSPVFGIWIALEILSVLILTIFAPHHKEFNPSAYSEWKAAVSEKRASMVTRRRRESWDKRGYRPPARSAEEIEPIDLDAESNPAQSSNQSECDRDKSYESLVAALSEVEAYVPINSVGRFIAMQEIRRSVFKEYQQGGINNK